MAATVHKSDRIMAVAPPAYGRRDGARPQELHAVEG